MITRVPHDKLVAMVTLDNLGMLNRLILKVTKFQLPLPNRLGTVGKNILKGHHGPPCQIGLIKVHSRNLMIFLKFNAK